jgi:FAD/FMN-containing dehydrogenase
MPMRVVSSWGNVARGLHAVYALNNRWEHFPSLPRGSTVLPFGNGRSYGDSCLNVGGGLLQTRSLDRFDRFDRDTGVLACEAGVLLADVLRVIVPAGWFLPVVPGTSQITVGGAIANDVHGKNHHRAGTFGSHVLSLELLRSNGDRLRCSPTDNSQLFSATVGGLGLTGVITWAELRLRRIPGPWMAVETVHFENLRGFFRLCTQADLDFEYTVSWIDCLARGERLGRGVLQRAEHAAGESKEFAAGRRRLAVPFVLPTSLLNATTQRLFNSAYYHRHRLRRARKYYPRFFFPLDRIGHWNRLYGPHGFYQYHCVVPDSVGEEATRELLQTVAAGSQVPVLGVLKRFGSLSSPGMLSFPRQGVTLALDFPNAGSKIELLFRELDRIVHAADGRLYPAKDARMPGELFRAAYPCWQEFAQYVDPACSSSFWRRVTENRC